MKDHKLNRTSHVFCQRLTSSKVFISILIEYRCFIKYLKIIKGPFGNYYCYFYLENQEQYIRVIERHFKDWFKFLFFFKKQIADIKKQVAEERSLTFQIQSRMKAEVEEFNKAKAIHEQKRAQV